VPVESPIATQTAMATTSTAEPTPAMPSAKKHARIPRPAARMRHDFASAQFERRWDRRGERRGGFGLFLFGRRFARTELAGFLMIAFADAYAASSFDARALWQRRSISS